MTRSMKRRFRKILLASTLALLGATGCDLPPERPSGVPSAEAIYVLEGDAALAAARSFVIGTWTYTGVTEDGNFWLKWVIKDDWTMEYYAALPTANDWGAPIIYRWSIVTEKYINTGKCYYAIQINDKLKDDTKHPDPMVCLFGVARALHRLGTLSPERGIIKSGIFSDSIEYRLDKALVLERGNKFPFSK